MTAIRLIGVPMDLGASRRGVDMGPFAVRYTDLREKLERIGHTVEDLGNVAVPFREDAERGAQRGARYLGAITSVCREVSALTRTAMEESCFPMLLGGDHSLAAGSIAGAAAFHAARGERIGVIWIDAHSDLNTPGSSKSGNVHGMPLAHLLGHGDGALANVAGVKPAVRAENVAIVGLRDADDAEREHIAKWKIRALTMRSIDERGIRSVMDEAIEVASNGTAGIWVSFDLDCLDPEAAPGVGTPVPGGMTYREAHLAMEKLADTGKVVGIDLVEVNPVMDEYNRTAGVGTDLLLSAVGKQIL
ncbi:MAG TPA: arginase [Gemmatimonadaceae bacterium]|nr:arginase [Gemmatimonadaceae bacterium]